MKEKKKVRVGEREGSKDRSTEIGLDRERDCNTLPSNDEGRL